jgi:hypothetical protein
VAAWGWDKSPDPAQHRRLRRLQRAQRLATLRADIERAALRHPSMVELPPDAPDARAG